MGKDGVSTEILRVTMLVLSNPGVISRGWRIPMHLRNFLGCAGIVVRASILGIFVFPPSVVPQEAKENDSEENQYFPLNFHVWWVN